MMIILFLMHIYWYKVILDNVWDGIKFMKKNKSLNLIGSENKFDFP